MLGSKWRAKDFQSRFFRRTHCGSAAWFGEVVICLSHIDLGLWSLRDSLIGCSSATSTLSFWRDGLRCWHNRGTWLWRTSWIIRTLLVRTQAWVWRGSNGFVVWEKSVLRTAVWFLGPQKDKTCQQELTLLLKTSVTELANVWLQLCYQEKKEC